MGKEWLYWGGGTKKGRGGDKNSTPSPSGCMNAVFQLFDNLPPFHFALPHHPSFVPNSLPQEPNIFLKGIEAPRNSLELMELTSSSSSTMKQQHSLNLPMGIQIKTSSAKSKSKSKSRTDDLSSECSSSPGTKTPSLVARLMGLDLLPELSFPRPSASSNNSTPNPPSKSSSSHHCRSLPETPRISMARRSDADNYHHRHSLQANKENIFTSEELSKWPDVQMLSSYLNAKLARRRESNRNEDEMKNSNLYAKQIVKQVRENISRRVGTDITNAMARKEHRRDEHLVLPKSKKPLTRMGGQDESTLSSSQRLRFFEVETKPISLSSATKCQSSVPPMFQVAPLKKKESEIQQMNKAKKLEKVTSERYDFESKRSIRTVDAIRNKKEEPFIRSSSTSKVKVLEKKCRKTPLSNNLVNINTPQFLSYKKDPSPSTPILSKNQVSSTQSSRSQSQSYISKAQYNRNSDDNPNGAIPTTTTASRLMFDLVNELSDCRVLEDIEALIDGDLCRSRHIQRSVTFEEERKGIVMEIERDIVDTLVHETAMMMTWQGRTR